MAEERNLLNINNAPREPIQEDTTFNLNEIEAGEGIKQPNFVSTIDATRSALERASLEPIHAVRDLAGSFDDDHFLEEASLNTLEEVREEQLVNQFYSDAPSYGISGLRYLPETTASFLLPLKLYAMGIRATQTSASAIRTGTAVGALEGQVYLQGREGYRGLSLKERALASATGGLVANALGQATRGYIAGATGKQVEDIILSDVVTTGLVKGYRTSQTVSNATANIISPLRKNKIMSVGAGGLYLSQEDAEGSLWGSASRVVSKSSQDVKNAIVKRTDKHGDMSYSLKKAEEDLVPNLSDYQNVVKTDLVEGFFEGIGYEVGRSFKASPLDDAIDDIVNNSTLREKNAPIEAETVLRQNIEEAFPSGVGRNDEIRESLGHMFRTGATADDIKAFYQGNKIKEDLAMSNIATKLSDEELSTLLKGVDDIAKNTFDKSIKMPMGKNSATLLKSIGLDAKLSAHVDDLIKSKAMNNVPKNVADDVLEALSSNPRAVDNVFGFRDGLNSKTSSLIKSGVLKESDADFAFSSARYKNVDPDVETVILSKAEMDSIDKVQGMSNALNKVFRNNNLRVVKKKELDDGTFEVQITGRSDRLQGPIVTKSEKARGSAEQNTLEVPIPVSSYRGSTPTKVNARFVSKDGSIVDDYGNVDFQKYKALKQRNIDEGIDLKDFSEVTHSAIPLTRAQQEFLGISDDIADVAGKTIAQVQKDLGVESMYTRVKSEYSTTLDGTNPHNFVEGFSTDPKYLFIGTTNNATKNIETMQTIANNYIRIDDPILSNKIGAKFVLKEHAFTLMGYNKMYATDYTYSMSRFAENMYRDMVSVFRSSVVLKNPVSMVNNIVAMAFTNFAYQYVSKGSLSGKAFKGLTGSYKGYKTFVKDRATLMNMKASGASEQAMLAFRRSNLDGTPSYELYKRGGLQSLLDDGLAERGVVLGNETGGFENAVRSVFLSADTKAGQTARYISDMGDITNRINMFDELVQGGMHPDVAIKEVQNMAVNYTRLLNPSFNFARETGIAPFITWYSRFLPQFAKVISDNPMRSAKLQGMYLAMTQVAGEEDSYGNNYIAGVNTENWNAFNSFAPSNFGDVFSGPTSGLLGGDFDSKSLIPAHINQVLDGNVRLVTTR